MSKTFKDQPENQQRRSGPSHSQGRSRRRNISVRAVRRDPPDLRKLSRALIALAQAEAEAANQRAAKSGETETAQAAPAGAPDD
jgi:hypothetical protein